MRFRGLWQLILFFGENQLPGVIKPSLQPCVPVWEMYFKDMFQEERRRWCAGRDFVQPDTLRGKTGNKMVLGGVYMVFLGHQIFPRSLRDHGGEEGTTLRAATAV